MSINFIEKLAIVCTFGVIASGCAPMISGAMNLTVTDETVIEKTVSYFGTNSGEVKISDINKNALDTSYKAVYKKTLYNCNIYYGSVTCKQPGA